MRVSNQEDAAYEKIVKEKDGYASVYEHGTDIVFVLKGLVHGKTTGKIVRGRVVCGNGSLDSRRGALSQGQRGSNHKN